MSLNLVRFTPVQSHLPGCILRQHAVPVDFSKISAKTLQSLIRELLILLYKHKEGVGLAATMAGIPLRIVVIDLDRKSPKVLINPVLIEVSGTEKNGFEGNLCFPRCFCLVKRPKRIKVKAFDQCGNPFELDCAGFMARVILHELDILDGIMFFDDITEFNAFEDRGPTALTRQSMDLLQLNTTYREEFKTTRWNVVTISPELLGLQEIILRQDCEPIDISTFDSCMLKEIIQEMFWILYKYRISGLAAPQVGLRLPIVVISMRRGSKIDPLVLINPVITTYSEETELYSEHCPSIPGYISHQVERSKNIIVSAWDQHGKSIEMKAEGLLAQVIQRQVDYLHGILYTDHLKKLTELVADDPVILSEYAIEKIYPVSTVSTV